MFETEGTLLRSYNTAEADRLLVLYTQREGKKILRARGIRKTTSKLSGHIGYFFLTSIVYVKGREIDVLTGAAIVEDYRPRSGDIDQLCYRMAMLEVIEQLTPEGQHDEHVWQLVCEMLQKNPDVENAKMLWAQFTLELLRRLGWELKLHECVHCRARVSPEVSIIDLQHGGSVCSRCSRERSESYHCPNRQLLSLLSGRLDRSWLSQEPMGESEQFFQIVLESVRYQTDRPLRSIEGVLRPQQIPLKQ